MEIAHPGENGRAAGAEAVGGESVVRRRDDLGVVREAEIVVGRKIDDRERFPAIAQSGARLGRTEQDRLIQFDRFVDGVKPLRKRRRRLQGIFAVAHQEIAEAEFVRIVFDRGIDLGFRR